MSALTNCPGQKDCLSDSQSSPEEPSIRVILAMKTTMSVLLVTLTLTLRSAGADKPLGMWCTISGQELRFAEKAAALCTADGGLSLMAHNGRACLCISLPKAQVGVQRSADTARLALDYVRDVISSDSRASYSARSEVPNSRVEVTVSREELGRDGNQAQLRKHSRASRSAIFQCLAQAQPCEPEVQSFSS